MGDRRGRVVTEGHCPGCEQPLALDIEYRCFGCDGPVCALCVVVIRERPEARENGGAWCPACRPEGR